MNALFPYTATTHGVTVRVQPSFLPDQSDPDAGVFMWSYHIRIENGGAQPVQLLRRRWLITDALGRREEVEGAGVIGETPVIAPGESYDYVSGCPLNTPSGTMQGSYAMRGSDGDFAAEIPAFSLDSPYARATRH